MKAHTCVQGWDHVKRCHLQQEHNCWVGRQGQVVGCVRKGVLQVSGTRQCLVGGFLPAPYKSHMSQDADSGHTAIVWPASASMLSKFDAMNSCQGTSASARRMASNEATSLVSGCTSNRAHCKLNLGQLNSTLNPPSLTGGASSWRPAHGALWHRMRAWSCSMHCRLYAGTDRFYKQQCRCLGLGVVGLDRTCMRVEHLLAACDKMHGYSGLLLGSATRPNSC